MQILLQLFFLKFMTSHTSFGPGSKFSDLLESLQLCFLQFLPPPIELNYLCTQSLIGVIEATPEIAISLTCDDTL